MVSTKANKIGESPTFKVTSKAKAMKAEGIDVIDLSVGEPDFPTPDNIKEAGIRAIRENYTKYTPIGGLPALKKAVVHRLKEDCGLDYKTSEILISTGAKSSLFHLIQAIINAGDEVIIPSPYWVTYPHAVNLAEGKPVIIRTTEENGFLLTPDQLKAAITPSTKALLLNNPSNPTGAAYTRQQLEALAEIVLEENITVIADEIYEKLVYDDMAFTSFASLGEEIKKLTAVINGVSKAYAMTGWRIGYTAAPEEIISAMNRIQGHTTSNPNTIAQMASLEALNGPQYEISRMVAEFQRRRNYMQMRLQALPEVSCHKSQGAFYLFPNLSAYYNKEFNGHPIRNSYGMAYFLLKEANVAIVPGDAFGDDDYIRCSYANSMENLEKGLDRMAAALSRLKTARKDKRIALNNTITRMTGSVPVESTLSLQKRDALVAEMESSLTNANYFEWNANINGVIIQLRTNVPHLNDFWIENWYPAQLEADLEPHGIIYAVDGIPGRESRIFYSRESQTGMLINTDNYGPLRSLAIGLVSDISSRLFQVNAVRGMAGDIDGRGFILIGPKGTKKTELFFSLMKKQQIRLQTNDMVFVRFSGSAPLSDSAERKLFMPTQTVAAYSPLAPLFDGCKCENVVIRKEDCRNETCLGTDNCRLDRGSPFCYDASKKSYAMLDPYWLDGPEKHTKRTQLRWIFILRNDRVSPPHLIAETEDALRILEAGENLGARTDISTPAAFFNPHLLDHSSENMDGQRQFFRRLLNSTSCYLFNSGTAGSDDLLQIISGE